MSRNENVIENPTFRDRVGVYVDRGDAGHKLAKMMEAYRDSDALVVAIPAGGVPVAMELAATLNLAIDVAPVSKITFPWDTESGYGAVGFDGTVRLNEPLIASVGLGKEAVASAREKTLQKVLRRMRLFRHDAPFPRLDKRVTIVVDDGLASGFTMHVALEVLRNAGAKELVVAVPTAHTDAISRIAREANQVYCANVRSGRRFAVASAYQSWCDVSDDEVVHALHELSREPCRAG